MKLKIKEAIALHNARQEKEKTNDSVHKRKLTTHLLGEVIYPDSGYESVSVSMGKLMRGDMKKLNPEWIISICGVCDVDPNFLYGYGFSSFNDEYDIFFPTVNGGN